MRSGCCSPPVRGAEVAVAVALTLIAASAANASPTTDRIDIAAGPLGRAIIALGTQRSVSIGLGDAGLAALPVRALRGRMTVGGALDRLLAGLPARVIRIDALTFRIVAAAPAARRMPPAHEQDDRETRAYRTDDIVVSASKRGTALSAYAGSAVLLDGYAMSTPEVDRGSEAIIERVPSLSSTQLGPGRNKLFIRGVADSSFNGPSQAIVGQYLGDFRLNYNAPDPDLLPYDTQRIEVLEGPQGTLYGAGSLGGVVRIVPNSVNLDRVEGAATAGLATTAHGGPGSDIAAMLNIPLIGDRAGLRAIGYRNVDGGYIDDAGRNIRDVNHGATVGGRLALTAVLGDWTIDLGAALQDIHSADGQYAERGLPPLTRSSAIAQPFDNDYAVGGVTVRRSWTNDLQLASSTNVVQQDVRSRYDFTPAGSPGRAYDQSNSISLLANETRLSRSNSDGTGWLVGGALLRDHERISRVVGGMRITGVRNNVYEGAAFGEATLRTIARLYVTAGARLSYDHLAGSPVDLKSDGGEVDGDRSQTRIVPSIALGWRPSRRLQVFVRYDEGFRPGGLSVSDTGSALQVQRFRGDAIGTVEIGLRVAGSHWDGAMTLARSRWKHIQADLVGLDGLPYTANIGSGLVRSGEARIGWRPTADLSLDVSLTANDSDLDRPVAAFVQSGDPELPNIPDFIARAGFTWRKRLAGSLALTVDGWARYVGHSRLGVGPILNIAQGAYVDDALALRVGSERFGVTLNMTNLADSAGNRFALGDPFSVARGLQETPLRPRTVQISLDGRF